MQVALELLVWFILEIALWPVGAAIKKLLGRPLSQSGNSEWAIGLAAIMTVFFLAIWWAHRV